MKFDWTPDRIDVLRERRARGVSASAIAAELGCTRSAVLGKAMRLGLDGELGRPRRPRGSAASAPDVVLLEDIWRMQPEAGVPLRDLRMRHCRWVLRGGAPWAYCGARRERGSYCAEHARLVYYTPKKESAP